MTIVQDASNAPNMWDEFHLRPFFGAQRNHCDQIRILNSHETGSNSRMRLMPALGDTPTTTNRQSVWDCLQAEACILLVGEREAGKSILAKGLASDLSAGYVGNPPAELVNRLPVFLDLKNLPADLLAPGSTLADAVLYQANHLLFETAPEETLKSLRAWVERGETLLILDGLNGLSTEQLSVAAQWCKQSKRTLATSRSADCAGFEDFAVKHLLPFEQRDINNNVAARLLGMQSVDNAHLHEFRHNIEKDPKLKALVQQPFWLNVTLHLHLGNLQITNDKALMMKSFVERVLGKTSRSRQALLGLPFHRSLEALSLMGFRLFSKEQETGQDAVADLDEWYGAVLESMEGSGLDQESVIAKANTFFWQAYKVNHLLKQSAHDMAFSSLSVMQYFAAQHLCQRIVSPSFARGISTDVTSKKLAAWFSNAQGRTVIQMTLDLIEQRYHPEWIDLVIGSIAKEKDLTPEVVSAQLQA